MKTNLLNQQPNDFPTLHRAAHARPDAKATGAPARRLGRLERDQKYKTNLNKLKIWILKLGMQ